MAPSDIAAVCRLDIAWAHRRASENGHSFHASKSQSTGRRDSPDDVALLTLHSLRVHMGNKKQSRESRAWLAILGVFSPGLGLPLKPVQ